MRAHVLDVLMKSLVYSRTGAMGSRAIRERGRAKFSNQKERSERAVGHERYKISVLSRKRIRHGTVTVTCIEDIYRARVALTGALSRFHRPDNLTIESISDSVNFANR